MLRTRQYVKREAAECLSSLAENLLDIIDESGFAASRLTNDPLVCYSMAFNKAILDDCQNLAYVVRKIITGFKVIRL